MKRLLLVFLLAEVVIGDLWDVYLRSNLMVTKELYEKQFPEPEQNFVFSPASTQAISAIVALSAKGETQNQLIRATHFTLNKSEIAEIYSNLSHKLPSGLLNVFAVHVGNINLNSYYQTFLKRKFNASIETGPDQTYTTKILTESTLDLTNNIIFQHQLILDVPWATKFNEAGYSIFHVTKYKNQTTPGTLHANEKLNYHNNEVLQAEFLEIPIIDNELTLTIVLPNEIDGLANVEKYLSDVLSAQPYEKLNVSVTIPKHWHTDLQYPGQSLRSLGVCEPFHKAEFMYIGGDSLRIDSGLQKTYIDIDKAISADQQPSGSSVTPVGPQSEKNFTADHPFIYYIKHNVMGVVLMGRYVKIIYGFLPS